MPDLFERLVSAIYQGPLEPKPWLSFTELLRIHLDATAVALVLMPSSSDRIEISVRADAEDCGFDWVVLNRQYNEHYIDIDPTNSTDIQPGEYRDVSNYRDSLYYTEFLQPLGIYHAFRMSFAEPGGMRCWISAARTEKNKPFDQDVRDLLGRIKPHLEQAMAIFSKLKLSENKAQLYQHMTSQLNIGLVLLNDRGVVIDCNDIAKQLLEDSGVVSLRSERLKASSASDNQVLQKSIDELISLRNNGQDAVKLCRFDRDSENLVSVLLRTIPQHAYFYGDVAPAIVIYLSNLYLSASNYCGRTTSLRLVSDLFGLTQAESRLALLLADGKSLVEISEELSISERTARNHSKNIYEKTGIKRQANLVRLIYQSVVLLS
ncbi:helix-turn-helix transcriptional regulator [Parahaliea mediterranea]|uniref:Helix-turn-helix transcriptional regulator n=1 Tax=Parahaliea mediterranea TaxID=651086 RepID=A0A939DFP2_9GAMM|nr:helix-turn-helix transcriptional regulator [Parahaliea mediterranea]MBN7796662.1 helix-turn-helix transcriptional regulator [Parahaliea mediterranea]